MAATQPSELVLDHVGPVQCIAAITVGHCCMMKITVTCLQCLHFPPSLHRHHTMFETMLGLLNMTITSWASTVRP